MSNLPLGVDGLNTTVLLLALLQGLLEWWPISSSGVITLISRVLGVSFTTGYEVGLSLHLASGLAALTLYWSRAKALLSELFSSRPSMYVKGYVAALAASIAIGLPLYLVFTELSEKAGVYAMLAVAAGLLITTYFLTKMRGGVKSEISFTDWLVTGALQGLAVLPGLSRSGLTIGYLCMRGYEPRVAVEASLLLAIPVLIAAGLYSAVRTTSETTATLLAQLVVYAVSLSAAKLLITTATRVKAYIFTLILAVLIIASTLLEILAP